MEISIKYSAFAEYLCLKGLMFKRFKVDELNKVFSVLVSATFKIAC